MKATPNVIKIGSDFFAQPVLGPQVPVVVHGDGCTRAPCVCFGISTAVHTPETGILVVRLLLDGEVVGVVRLLPASGRLMMVSAATYRASTTEDWAWHHQVVTELLLRESVRMADECGCALDTSWEEPRALLAELGFAPAGLVLRRARRDAGC